ncbi:MAG: hypothetical protein ACFCU8_13815 [Thermosynechococcaceae cyanobacterium]
MDPSSANHASSRRQDQGSRAETILQRIDSDVLNSFTLAQRSALLDLLTQITLESSPRRPRLIDIRFVIDLVVTRFYLVLLVGKDRRQRSRPMKGITKAGNILAAALLLLTANLVISAILLLSLYLIKSAVGINLLPGHFAEYLKHLF